MTKTENAEKLPKEVKLYTILEYMWDNGIETNSPDERIWAGRYAELIDPLKLSHTTSYLHRLLNELATKEGVRKKEGWRGAWLINSSVFEIYKDKGEEIVNGI